MNRQYGLFREVTQSIYPKGLPKLFRFNSVVADLSARASRGSATEAVFGGSLHFDRNAAAWAAVGEGLERYCGGIGDAATCRSARADELDSEAVEIGRYVRFSPNASLFHYESSKAYRWYPGMDVATGRKTYLPASTVWTGHNFSIKQERIYPTTTNGLGAGLSEGQALLSAIGELVERDAFNRHWFGKIAARPVRIDDAFHRLLHPRAAELLDNPVASANVYSLNSPAGLPVLMAIARSKAYGTVYLGASCAVDPVKALMKALYEAYVCMAYAFGIGPPTERTISEEAFTCFEDHLLHYHDPSQTINAAFLWGDAEACDYEELRVAQDRMHRGKIDSTEFLTRQVSERVGRVFAANITSADVKGLGFTVMRALIPNLLPLVLMNRDLPVEVVNRDGEWIEVSNVNSLVHPFA